MQKRWSLFFLAVLITIGLGACTRTKKVGLKPILEFKAEPGYIYQDTTVKQDKKYRIYATAAKSEDESALAAFEVTRIYQGSADTSVFYQELTGEQMNTFSYTHEFTTLKKAGTETYIFTVKNIYGIVNQKTITVTVN